MHFCVRHDIFFVGGLVFSCFKLQIYFVKFYWLFTEERTMPAIKRTLKHHTHVIGNIKTYYFIFCRVYFIVYILVYTILVYIYVIVYIYIIVYSLYLQRYFRVIFTMGWSSALWDFRLPIRLTRRWFSSIPPPPPAHGRDILLFLFNDFQYCIIHYKLSCSMYVSWKFIILSCVTIT